MATTSAHYISGTHWDREWYRPFQEFRILLVRLIDDLLELMTTNPEFKYFQLDGQTCVLEDYLEIRPDKRALLAQLIREGRILIGPWYTMPDLFCPDDESLVRSLLLGRRICHEWEVEPMPVGFICDMFGHPSQMPQIFAGFGLHDIVLGRGTNEFNTEMFFTWEAPDGSRGLVFKLQDRTGYGAFALPRAILEKSTGVASEQVPDREAFLAETAAAGDDPDRLAAVQEKFGAQALAGYIGHEVARANVPVIAVMDSMDHIPPAANVARYLRLIHSACENVAARHSTLPAFFNEVREKVANTSLEVRRGELRDPSREQCPYLWLIPNCVSARAGMKLANDTTTNLLERWAEPLLALAAVATRGTGTRELLPYLRVAWTQVLTNHAHDSICGCSVDQVHRDMMYRFDQAQVLGRQLRHQAFAELTADACELGVDDHDFTVVLGNPLPFRRRETVSFDIDLPLDYPTQFSEGFRTQLVKSFVIEDEHGKALPYQRLSFVPAMNERSALAQYCFISEGQFTRYTVAATVELPACGYTSLRVRPSRRPVRAAGSLRTGPVSAENDLLAVAVAANGTLTLTDKQSGQVYTDLLTFEDRSEVGDGWFHGHSLNDSCMLSSATPAQVEVVQDGPELVSFRSTVRLTVPLRYDWHTEAPGRETTVLELASLITLRRAGCCVEVTTTVNNTAEDHRLQLLLPTDVDADEYQAQTPYDVVTRAIHLDAQTADWQEMEITEKPFQNLQAVGDANRGLAVLCPAGIHEGGVRDDRRRTMQFTLLRSFRRTVGTEGERDGLELGQRAFSYALMPYTGSLPAASALRECARLQSGLIRRQSGPRSSGYPPLPAAGAATRSYLDQLDGKLVVSAIKPAEDGQGIVVRFWNPDGEARQDRLRCPERAVACYCDLKEDDLETQLHLIDGIWRIEAGPHQIVSVKLRFT